MLLELKDARYKKIKSDIRQSKPIVEKMGKTIAEFQPLHRKARSIRENALKKFKELQQLKESSALSNAGSSIDDSTAVESMAELQSSILEVPASSMQQPGSPLRPSRHSTSGSPPQRSAGSPNTSSPSSQGYDHNPESLNQTKGPKLISHHPSSSPNSHGSSSFVVQVPDSNPQHTSSPRPHDSTNFHQHSPDAKVPHPPRKLPRKI